MPSPISIKLDDILDMAMRSITNEMERQGAKHLIGHPCTCRYDAATDSMVFDLWRPSPGPVKRIVLATETRAGAQP